MTEGVFWVIARSKDDIKIGRFEILHYLDSINAHKDIWELLISKNKKLAKFDYERFPRGRVWKKGGEAYIFLNSVINIPIVIDKVNEIFNLASKYIIVEDR